MVDLLCCDRPLDAGKTEVNKAAVVAVVAVVAAAAAAAAAWAHMVDETSISSVRPIRKRGTKKAFVVVKREG